MNISKRSFLTPSDVAALLSKQIAAAGSQARWCMDNQVSTAYLSDVLNGRREPGKKILDVLGLESAIYYHYNQEKKMSDQQQFYPYDLAEHEETEALHVVAFGKVVPDTPTFAPDETEAARQYCKVLNEAYNAGVAGKGADDATTQEDPGYNTMTRNGS